MNKKTNGGEDISSLNVEQLLGLINSPQKDIVEEVRSLIKGQFNIVSDRWLVHGLMDYFFMTSSKRILDLLIAAPEPHDRYLLDRISEGVKGVDRFRHFSLLLYAVSRNPPPVWVYKSHILNVINCLTSVLRTNLKRDADISELVSGVMVLVVLLPIIPMQMQKYLNKIFQCFWVLVHWIPICEQENVLKLHLQVAVYSLFHRLYALYPCAFISMLRAQIVTESSKKAGLLVTLRPMLERVRFHPLLISETKDSECCKARWLGLEPSDLIHECAKLCLDPLQDICEETYTRGIIGRHSKSEAVADSGNFILYSSESSFWSPGVVQSPSSGTTSVPQTPVYSKYHILSSQSTGTGIAESPPEAAIEATPETTPFTSPLPRVAPSPMQFEQKFKLPGPLTTKSNITINLTSSLEMCQGKAPLSPLMKEVLMTNFPIKENKDSNSHFDKTNIIFNKLKQIQHERERVPECDSSIDKMQVLPDKEDAKTVNDDTKLDVCRRRKAAVFSPFIVDEDKQQDLFFERNDDKYENLLDEKLEPTLSDSGAHKEYLHINPGSYDSEEGINMPNCQSITELVKNVNTKRLRFLSQCGPPPNIDFILNEPAKVDNSQRFLLRQKSRSFPLLFCENVYIPKKDTTHSSLALSPIRPPIETAEASSQTEEISIINPYEQLLEVLALPTQSEVKSRHVGYESPYQALEHCLECGLDGNPIPNLELGWNNLQSSNGDLEKKQLRSLHSLIVLERYKREMHAERNRRLLGQIKRLHLLQEKDKGLTNEKMWLKDEILQMQNDILKLQGKVSDYEKLLEKMIEKKAFQELKEKEEKVCQQREQLRQMCGTLKEENQSLSVELESCRSTMHDMQRQFGVLSKHRVENDSLRKQVIDLNQKIVVMGEIQNEMRSQMKDLKYSQRKATTLQHSQLMNELLRKIDRLEFKNKNDSASLDATMLFAKQLEDKLKQKQKEVGDHKNEMEALSVMWQERCNVVEKRNKELHSINITLESQMLQLLKYRPERDSEEGSENRRLLSHTGQEGFPPLSDSRHVVSNLCVESEGSYVSRATDNTFRPIRSPASEKE